MRKYSEEFINNSDILMKSVCGFELEFYLKDLSYYKTLEMLNRYLSPIEIYGFRQYHPDFKPNSHQFCLTPDLSGGANLVEIITGPLPYYNAKFYLIKLLKFIQEYGYTTDRASIHFNISFPDMNLSDLNILKLILDIDEDEIYRSYPMRKNNVYAKSVKRIIPYKEYNFNDIGIGIIKNNLRLPDDKYYGVNFLHINKVKGEQRIEYRYIGGKDYEKSIGSILHFLDKFIITSYNCINGAFNETEVTDLENHLDKNISHFKSFSNYDNFLIQFPTITLQVDKTSSYELVSAYYHSFYDNLFILIDSTENLKDCILNWVTSQQRLEVIDGKIKCVINVSNFDFINCTVIGILEDCDIVNSVINDSQLIRCNLSGDEINKSKVINCVVENSDIKNSFVDGGYFNSNMEGGVFRSGKLGVYANISSTTKMVSDKDNFFNTKFDTVDKIKKSNKFSK